MMNRKGATVKHPFAKMQVGDVVEIKHDYRRLQMYVHVYGRSSGKKFSTKTHGDSLFVTRLS